MQQTFHEGNLENSKPFLTIVLVSRDGMNVDSSKPWCA